MYQILLGTADPLDSEQICFENDQFHACMSWLVRKANEYEERNKCWLDQRLNVANCILTLRIRSGEEHQYYRLYGA